MSVSDVNFYGRGDRGGLNTDGWGSGGMMTKRDRVWCLKRGERGRKKEIQTDIDRVRERDNEEEGERQK